MIWLMLVVYSKCLMNAWLWFCLKLLDFEIFNFMIYHPFILWVYGVLFNCYTCIYFENVESSQYSEPDGCDSIKVLSDWLGQLGLPSHASSQKVVAWIMSTWLRANNLYIFKAFDLMELGATIYGFNNNFKVLGSEEKAPNVARPSTISGIVN